MPFLDGANLLTQSLWRDEAFSVILALKGWWGIIQTTAGDFSPPFYYLVLRGWSLVFGLAEPALRALSILGVVLTAGTIYLIGRHLFSPRVGLLAAAATLLNPFNFYYAFEVRMYALLSFLAVLTFYLLIQERWGWFLLVALLGLYTHNFMIFSLLGSLGGYFALHPHRPPRGLLLALLGSALLFLPWLGIVWRQTAIVWSDFWIPPTRLPQVLATFTEFLVGPVSFSTIGHPSAPVLLGGSLFLLVLIILRPGRPNRVWRAVSIWLSLPLLLSLLVSLVVPTFLSRYLIFTTVPLMLLLASGAAARPRFWCLLALLAVMFWRDVYLFWRPDKFPIRERVRSLAEEWGGEPVLCESILNFFEARYYLLRLRPAAVSFLRLRPEGVVRYAGGALVSSGDLWSGPLPEIYFQIGASGEISRVGPPASSPAVPSSAGPDAL